MRARKRIEVNDEKPSFQMRRLRSNLPHEEDARERGYLPLLRNEDQGSRGHRGEKIREGTKDLFDLYLMPSCLWSNISDGYTTMTEADAIDAVLAKTDATCKRLPTITVELTEDEIEYLLLGLTQLAVCNKQTSDELMILGDKLLSALEKEKENG